MGHHRHTSPPLCRPPRAGRHHRMISVLSSSFLAWSGESLSLVPPSGRHCLSSHKAYYVQQYELLPYKRRRRQVLELQLQFSPDRDGGACRASSSLLPNSGYRAIDGRGFIGLSCRMSPSLLMAHSSDSAGGGFGKDDEKNKKRENNNGGGHTGGGSPKPKAGKSINKDESVGRPSGVVKGSSVPNDNRGGDHKNGKHPSDGAKHTRVKGEKKSNKQQKKNNVQAKSNANETIILDASKGSIKSSDENTSLKGFKSEKKNLPPRQNQGGSGNPKNNASGSDDGADNDMKKRIVQLETIVSNQMTEIQKLRRDVDDLSRAAGVVSKVIDVLRKAGMQIDDEDQAVVIEDDEDDDEVRTTPTQRPVKQKTVHYDMEIFGIAPKSVTDAADTAGASMLSAILAGKHRMLVDVRDAELTRDPKLLVEFIELAILPVAAGLEGLDSVRNRVKIVFPTVKELMSYRKSMALAAPEVVSLSTLGFDPVDERDNLIVVVAPSPDDMAGVAAMEKLIARTDKNYVEPDRRITQPVVVMNHHMLPVNMARFGKFTTVYHLRLLSVQYMTGTSAPEFVTKEKPIAKSEDVSESMDDTESVHEKVLSGTKQQTPDSAGPLENQSNGSSESVQDKSEEEDALEAAMTHAHEIGFHQGVTRAMVIRAYPKPWHVFVDTSPDTDADFEVAATFDMEPTQEDVNYAIVECLEGSEREDEIVAQQMQAALEAGQLNRVSEMLGISPSNMVSELTSDTDSYNPFQDYDGKDWDDLYYDDWISEDSV